MAIALGALLVATPSQASPPQTPRVEPWVADGTIRAIVQVGGVIYLGGDFTSLIRPSGLGAPLPHNRLAAIYASTGLPAPWNPNADGPVNALAVSPDGTLIYVAGEFTHVGGQPRNRIAAVSTASGLATAWNPNSNGKLHALVADGDLVFAGGQFTIVGGQPRNNIAALSAASGSAAAWDPNANGSIRTMDLEGAKLYVGGDFTTIDSLDRHYIASIETAETLTTSHPVTPWKPNADAPVYTLLVSKDIVYAGGDFSYIGRKPRNHIAALDSNEPVNNALPWDSNANDRVTSLALSAEDTLFAGGRFTHIGGQARRHLAELEEAINIVLAVGGSATAWNPNADSTVWALSRVGVALSSGGEFSTIGGNPRPALALFGTGSSQGLPQGGTGFWSQTSTWDPPVVPNNSGPIHFDVDVRGVNRMIILDIDAVIDSLNLVEGGGVDITLGSLFIAAPPGIHNLGSLRIGNGRSLLALAGISIVGVGPLRLDGDTAMLGTVGIPPDPCINAFGHTIAGFGQIVGNFTNDGMIIADMPGEVLSPSNPDFFVNNGLIRAIGGGIVLVDDPEILQAQGRSQPTVTNDGLIEAKDGGLVQNIGVAIVGSGNFVADGGTLKLLSDASFEASIAGANLDVKNGGIVQALDDSTIDLAGVLTLTSGGIYQGGTNSRGTADSTASLTADGIVVKTDEAMGGTLDMGGGMDASSGSGGVRLIGCGAGFARGCVPPALSISGSAARMAVGGPTLTIGGYGPGGTGPADLTLTGEVQLFVGSTAKVTLYGNFVNECTSPWSFNWEQGSLKLAGTIQAFEMAGADLGPRNPAGFVDNFAMGKIRVTAGAVVDFVDMFDNMPGPGCEALYVHTLVLEAGSRFRLHGCHVYYDMLVDSGAVVDLDDGGALMNTSAGDLNGDKVADLVDADIFANLLLGLDTDPAHIAAADLNGDGLVDGTDIAFMVEILTL